MSAGRGGERLFSDGVEAFLDGGERGEQLLAVGFRDVEDLADRSAASRAGRSIAATSAVAVRTRFAATSAADRLAPGNSAWNRTKRAFGTCSKCSTPPSITRRSTSRM
jgi:hypothetical protein